MKEHFQLLQSDTVERTGLGIRAGNVMVTVRDYNTLNHLKWALERIDTKEQDIVVMSARVSQFGSAAYDLSTEQIFSDYEQQLFTRAVSVAEGFGKHVSLLVVPARDPWSAIVQTANNLEASAVVSGLSSKMSAQEQAFYLGHAWEAMPEPKRQFIFQVVYPDLKVDTFHIGPHTPSLKTEDVHLVHRLWLNITREPGLESAASPRHPDRGPDPLCPRICRPRPAGHSARVAQTVRRDGDDSGFGRTTATDLPRPTYFLRVAPEPESREDRRRSTHAPQ